MKLELSHVARQYGGTAAVEDFTLDVADGEFISLLGPSGCGKTTMLRMIAGFVEPTRGTITMNGRVISAPGSVVPPERRNMSMIFQSYAIWPNMTVEENVRFGLTLRKMPAAEMKRRVDQILSVVRLSELAGRYPSELSGGQQQRVALARAIVVEPEVLLLDEPLSNLDANLRDEMRFEIRRMHDEFRITTIYVTHDQSEAMLTSDRIVVMNRGRIEQIDTPVALYERPRSRFVASFIGRTNLLPGRVEGGELQVGALRLPAARVDADGRTGEVSVSLRPQHILLDGEANAEREHVAIVEGTVLDAAYLGGFWEYRMDLGLGKPVAAVSGASEPFARGERIRARIDTRRMVVLDA